MRSTLKGKVLFILAENPETRNSDILLMTEIWKKFYPDLLIQNSAGSIFVPLKNLGDLPREDHIKRIRASIQNHPEEPKYLPTSEEVAIQRKMKIDWWREKLGYTVRGDTL